MKPAPLAAIIITFAVSGCMGSGAADEANSLIGTGAPDLTLKTLAGADVKLSDQKGKVVLMDVWATWCPPCRASMPHIQQLAADPQLSDRGLLVWAVDAAEERETVENYIKENKFTFTVPLATGASLKPWKIGGIPTTFIVGRDGIIKDVFVGYGKDSAKLIDDAVRKALAEPAPTR